METIEHRAFARPSADARGPIRYVAAAVSATVGVLYLILMFLVADAEAVPGATDGNTYGAYFYLSIIYLSLGALLVALNRWIVWAAGAVVQVLVIALFVIFGVGVFGPGVFEYEALSEVRVEVWAAVITGAQVILLGLLCYLTFAQTRSGAEPGPHPGLRRETRRREGAG